MAPVVVFGPTGQIGSVAANTAAKLGATVWLAMRDTDKTIPDLDKDSEAAGRFYKVHADLKSADTVSQAVQASGAKRAFVYLLHGAPDHMRGVWRALKGAGIEFVVFLSSFTIPTHKSLRDIPSSEAIPYIHAQAEANLDDVFGYQYVAVRPGAFATNLLHHSRAICAGNVALYSGGVFEQDNIVPSDIGRVCGNILVNGPQNGERKVYLYGPNVLSIHDSILEMSKTLKKPVKITKQDPQEAWDEWIKMGLPEAFARYMLHVLSSGGPDKGDGKRFPRYDEGVSNVEKYTGRAATSLAQWTLDNEAVFA